MKCIIVFVFVALFFSFSVNSEPVKRALIVAIGDYPVESGWKKLNSLNDVTIVKAALIHQGFHEKNIVVLTDKEATRAGIVKALDQMIERSKAGDIVYFHF
ncbi:MAG: caspase family protein, partial [Bacteroidales bacterium]|nr:caspase family protein [Bacteroidales bacterium]